MKPSKYHYSKNHLKEIKIELTYKCNLRCIHCSSEGDDSFTTKIPFNEVLKIIKSAKDMGVKTISFSGGEPLLYDKLHDIVNSANLQDIQVKIYTSGTTENYNEFLECIDRGQVTFIFSLYHSSSEIHDKVTGVRGSFHKTISALKLTKNRFDCEIHFVPLSYNYNGLESLCELVVSLGVHQISVLRFVPQGRGATDKSLSLNKTQWLELHNSIKKLRERGFSVRTGSPLNFLFLNDNPCCSSGLDKLVVAPDQKIYPCDAFKQLSSQELLLLDDEHSSLIHSRLQDCWNNSVYLNKIRCVLDEQPSDVCQACKMLSRCRTGCLAQKILSTGTFYGKDPDCILS